MSSNEKNYWKPAAHTDLDFVAIIKKAIEEKRPFVLVMPPHEHNEGIIAAHPEQPEEVVGAILFRACRGIIDPTGQPQPPSLDHSDIDIDPFDDADDDGIYFD